MVNKNIYADQLSEDYNIDGGVGYKNDESFTSMSDDEIDSSILKLLESGIDGFKKEVADVVLGVVLAERSNGRAPEKTQDWLALSELAAYFIGTPTRIYRKLQQLRYVMPYSIEERMVSGVQYPRLCLHRDALVRFAQKSELKIRNQITEKNDEWLFATDLAAIFNGHEAAIRKTLKDLYRKKSPIVRELKTATVCGLGLHRDAVEMFADEMLKHRWQHTGRNAVIKQRFIRTVELAKANDKFEKIRNQVFAESSKKRLRD